MRNKWSLIYWFFNTESRDFAAFITRVILGVVVFAHGGQKLFGWFWWFGFDGTMSAFTWMWLPFIIALLVILWESLWSLALIIGFCTRFMALWIFIILTGAMIMAHAQYGFYINWFGNQAWNGIEFHLLWIGMALALIFSWWWALSFDLLIKKMWN